MPVPELILLGLFLPLASSFVLAATSFYISRGLAGFIACGAVFISFCSFFYTFWAPEDAYTITLFNWVAVDAVNAKFTLTLDHLAHLMTLIITGIGFLIHVYANGYMDHDRDYARFFSQLNFFVFAMLLLVLAGDLLVLFVGWEGVGLASYLLIGFWYERPKAANAAVKAFVVNRVGDLGFLLALLLTFQTFGTSDIATITKRAVAEYPVGAPLITVMTLLYFFGATGKSAQLPLHTWLADAMEGPTPVSALIHAATMVTAGVYLVVRLHSLFLLAPFTMQVVAVVGAVTSLFAAFCAIGQTDLKRVLAYSTVSQLGLMFLACGVGAFYAAMFHLTTHAFVKALLFLSAGNVVHMMHGTTEMGQMGGLSKIFTKTNWLFLIGVLALGAIPPFAAFFSKELILEVDYAQGAITLFYIGIVVTVLTAFYLTRAYLLAFRGHSHVEHPDRVKEAPSIMTLPLTVLALLSIFGGLIGFSFTTVPPLRNYLSFLGITPAEAEFSSHFEFSYETDLALLAAFTGLISAAILYTKFRDRLGPTLVVLKRAFFVDELYHALFVVPLSLLSRFISYWVEPVLFEGSIDVTARAAQGTARGLQHIQSGQVRSYVAWMALGMVLLIAYFVLFEGSHV